MGVSVRRVTADDAAVLDRIMALGRRNSQYLGFMPKGGYQDRVQKGTLLVALREDEVLGYVLYDLPRLVVHIAHICVARTERRAGIARLLVDELSKRHADRRGIELMVRNDFPAFNMWFKLGFVPKAEVKGKAKDGLLKTLMWLDHGQADLFTWAEAPQVALTAVVDASVFFDLHGDDTRSTHPATAELIDAIAGGAMELVVAPELEREVSRHKVPGERRRLRDAIAGYRTVAVSNTKITALATDMSQDPRLRQRVLTENDHADLRYIAAASLAGIGVVLTKDEAFPTWATAIARSRGIQLLDPRGAIIRIDESSRSAAYSPRALQGTELSVARVGSSDVIGLSHRFINMAARERRRDFKRLLEGVLGRSSCDVQVVAAAGSPIALWSARIDRDDLVVDLMRVVPTAPLAATVAAQLVFMIRNEARARGARRVIVGDPAATQSVQLRLERDGFVATPAGLTAATPPDCKSRSEWATDLASRPTSRGSAQLLHALELCAQERPPTAAEASEFERLFWPAKLVDADLPTFLVPINQRWSSDLFGVPQALQPRSTVLGLSREHIYYRSPRPQGVSAPGRVIWYLTAGRNEPLSPGAFACSRLEEVVRDSPAVLFARFKHLGVYERDHVHAAAKNGEAQAIRVADTEIFTTLVGLDRLRELANRTCQTLHLRSPQRLAPELFDVIYREGAVQNGRG